MKTTIFGVLLDVTPDQDTVLRRLMHGLKIVSRLERLRIGTLANSVVSWNTRWGNAGKRSTSWTLTFQVQNRFGPRLHDSENFLKCAGMDMMPAVPDTA